MSALLSSRPKAVTLNIRERTRAWLTPLNLHWAGLGALGLLNLYLLVHMAFAYQTARSNDADAIAAARVDLKTAQIAARPLEGLDAKLKTSSEQADRFTLERLPLNYSEVASELGRLAKKQGVKLARVQYKQNAVAGDAAGQLTEVQMDASLTGDYRSLVTFINQMERDKVFFVISAVTLTGQQTGQVSLRLRVTSYLRGLGSADELQQVTAGSDAAATGGAQ